MKRQVISTDKGPRTGLPYSQGIRHGDLVFVAGQVALDPATGQVVAGGIREQTRQVLENVEAILGAAGTSLAHAVEALCLLHDIADFGAFNEVYKGFFPKDPPARTTVQAVLPRAGASRRDPGRRGDAAPAGGARREAGPPGAGQAAPPLAPTAEGRRARRAPRPESRGVTLSRFPLGIARGGRGRGAPAIRSG